MIKDFSVLYAGHVLEGDGIGFDGIPANDRWYDNDRLSMAMDIARQAAVFLDDLGFDILWMAEHHFQREGYECIPNLLIMSQYLAQHTQRIKFGCGFNILPMWHPIRLAEDFAMVDILTGGRVVFGIGRGYHTREVESFGAPMIDGDANRELFEEQFEIMMKAFNNESFSHQGKHYTIPPDIPYRGYDLTEVTLVPRPKTRPVDVWQPIVSASDRALDFMAKWGIKGVILGTGEQYVAEWVQRYQAANRRPAGTWRWARASASACGPWWTTPPPARAASCSRCSRSTSSSPRPLGMLRYSDQQIAATGPGGVARHIAAGTDFQDVIDNRAWFAGSPEDTIAYLEELQDKYPGLEQVMIAFPMGATTAQFKEQMGRFAAEVIPHFKESTTAGAEP